MRPTATAVIAATLSGLFGILGPAAFQAQAQNLLVNPNFDTSVSGWGGVLR
jgi:hypothetical protein